MAEQATALSKARAEGRRKKKFPEARDYSWPKPQHDEGFWTAVSQHLGRYALHLMYEDEGVERRLTLQDLLEWQSIAERLEAHVWAAGGQDIYYRDQEHNPNSRWMIAAEDIERLCQQAEAFAREVYKPIRQRLAEAGAKGGKRSRRGKSFTIPVIEGFDRMTPTQQAEAIQEATGCSPRTAWRRLQEAKSLPNKPVSALDEELTLKGEEVPHSAGDHANEEQDDRRGLVGPVAQQVLHRIERVVLDIGMSCHVAEVVDVVVPVLLDATGSKQLPDDQHKTSQLSKGRHDEQDYSGSNHVPNINLDSAEVVSATPQEPRTWDEDPTYWAALLSRV